MDSTLIVYVAHVSWRTVEAWLRLRVTNLHDNSCVLTQVHDNPPPCAARCVLWTAQRATFRYM